MLLKRLMQKVGNILGGGLLWWMLLGGYSVRKSIRMGTYPVCTRNGAGGYAPPNEMRNASRAICLEEPYNTSCLSDSYTKSDVADPQKYTNRPP